MAYKRADRVNALLQRELGTLISEELSDPRIAFTTVTSVEVTDDLRSARVFVSVLGDDEAVKKTMVELKRNILLRDHFSPIFLTRALECDRLWAGYSRERERIGKDPALIGQLLKRIYPVASEGGKMKQHAKALRESAEHFFLNPNA